MITLFFVHPTIPGMLKASKMGFSIIKAETPTTRRYLGDKKYEIMDPSGDIHRFSNMNEVQAFIRNWIPS